MKREQKKNIENLEKVIEEKKKIPKDLRKKINFKTSGNLLIAAIIIIYFVSLWFGMLNIPTENYTVDLKVFAVIFLVMAIILFEYGYKKDNGEIWLHGVETTIFGIFTLYLTYLYKIFYAKYWTLLLSAGIIVLIYYAIKILVIQRRMEKEYRKTLTDIGEIVKK